MLLNEVKSKNKNIIQYPNYEFEITQGVTRLYDQLPKEAGTSGGLINAVHKTLSDSCIVLRDDNCLYMCTTIDKQTSLAFVIAYCPPYDDNKKHEDSILVLGAIQDTMNILLNCGFTIVITLDANGSLGNIMHNNDNKTNEFGMKYLLPFIKCNDLKIVNPRNAYTWFAHNGKSKATLDYVLISNKAPFWNDNSINCVVSNEYTGSDHSMLISTIKINTISNINNQINYNDIFQPPFSIRTCKSPIMIQNAIHQFNLFFNNKIKHKIQILMKSKEIEN